MVRVAPTFGVLLGLALLVPAAVFMAPSTPSAPEPMSVQLHLYGSSSTGWGLSAAGETIPGPTLSANEGDLVTIWLTSSDGLPHEFYIDYNRNDVPDTGEPTSPAFSTDVNLTFTAVVAGTFAYFCLFHPATMRGTWTVNASPSPHVDAPGTGTDWTGGSPHSIVFSVTDDGSLTNVRVWVNYSYNAGASGGTIAGPLTPTAGANAVTWTPGIFNATDVVVNVTAADDLGARNSALSPPIVVDSAQPSVVGVTPSPDATSVPLTAAVRVQWSEPMNTTSVATPATVSLKEVSGGAYATGTFSWMSSGATMDFTPTAPLKPAVLYELRVNTSAKDASSPGNSIAAPVTTRFTTLAVADTVAPTVAAPTITEVSTSPGGGTVNITVSVTDDVAVRDVILSVSSPAPSGNESFAMLPAGGSAFYLNRSFAAGSYNYSIRGADTSGNVAYRNGTFTVTAGAAHPPNPTGADYLPWVAAALAFVVAGVGAALILRRRRKLRGP